MPESTPKPTRATLPTMRPAPIATTASTTFQATVNTSWRTPLRCSLSFRESVAPVIALEPPPGHAPRRSPADCVGVRR